MTVYSHAQAQVNELNPALQPSVVIPPSPSSAALAKYGDYPVDLSTGVPEISVPLFTIQEGDYNLPLSLSYHAGGIKVDEIGSWVGLGWSLNTGGMVSRTVNGLPDEVNEPGIHEGYWSTQTWLDGLSGYQENAETFWKYKRVTEAKIDTEPDHFSFQVAGFSGSFVLTKDATGNLKAVQFKKQPVIIQPVLIGNDISAFTITDPKGNIYKFEVPEETEYTFNHQLSFKSSWHLSKIEPIGGGAINYSYGTHDVLYDVNRQRSINYERRNDNLFHEISESSSVQQAAIPQARKVKQITYSQGEVYFNWQKRDEKGAKLQSIIVKDLSGNTINNISLRHNSFPGSGYRRLRLDEVKIYGNDLKEGQNYQFEYYGDHLPALDSPDRDYMGFYNGANNRTAIPRYEYGYQQYIGENADRMPKLSYSLYGTLKSITHPTGGKTLFNFEANKYSTFKGKIRLNYDWAYRLEHKDETQSISVVDQSWPSQVLIFPEDNPAFREDDIIWEAKQATIEFGTMDNDQGNPSQYNKGNPFARIDGTEYSLSLAGTYQYNPQTNYHVAYYTSPISGSSFDIRLQTSGLPGNYIALTLSAEGTVASNYPLYNDPNIDVGGIRIREIKNVDVDEKTISSTTYSYIKDMYSQGITESSASLLQSTEEALSENGKAFVQSYSIKYGCYNDGSAPDLGSKLPTTRYTISENPSGISASYPVLMYNKVYVKNVDVNNTARSQLAVNEFKLFPETNLSNNYPNPVFIYNSHLRGILTKRSIYKSTADNEPELSKVEEYFYSRKANSAELVKAIKIANNREYYWDFSYQDVCEPYNQYNAQQFSSLFYYYMPSFIELDSLVSTEFYHGESMKRAEHYTYDKDYQTLIRKDIVGAEGTVELEYTYPHSYEDSSLPEYGFIQEMKNKNMVSYPLETRVYRKFEGQRHHIYSALQKYQGEKPSEYYLSYETPAAGLAFRSSEQMEGFDTRYGEAPERAYRYFNGKITEVKTKNAVVSYFWSYNNQYPIIKLTGVDINTTNSIFNNYSSLRYSLNPTNNQIIQLRADLEAAFPEATISSYTYRPSIGISTITDANGQTIHYTYDSQARLQRVTDHDGNALEYHVYKYFNPINEMEQ